MILARVVSYVVLSIVAAIVTIVLFYCTSGKD